MWLDVSAAAGRPLAVRWLDIRASRWIGEPVLLEVEGSLARLVTPREEGYWAALVKRCARRS